MGVYLPKPKTTKESLDGGKFPHTTTEFGLSAMQGWRQYMEDAHLADPEFQVNFNNISFIGLFGVFDGHGGPAVSTWVAKEFRRVFQNELNKSCSDYDSNSLKSKRPELNRNLTILCEGLQRTFLKLDEEMSLPDNRKELKRIHEESEKKKKEEQEQLVQTSDGGGVSNNQPESFLDALISGVSAQRPIIRIFERDGQKCYRVMTGQNNMLSYMNHVIALQDPSETEFDESNHQKTAEDAEKQDSDTNVSDEMITTDAQTSTETTNLPLNESKGELDSNDKNVTTEESNVEESGRAVKVRVLGDNQYSGDKDFETTKTSNIESCKPISNQNQNEENVNGDNIKSTSDEEDENRKVNLFDNHDAEFNNDFDKFNMQDGFLKHDLDYDDEDDSLNLNTPLSLDLNNDCQPYQPESCGTTAVVALIVSGENPCVIAANAGDSRVVMSRNGVAVPLSKDHKPFLRGEARRIKKAGGKVMNGRVDGNLNLSRALGDLFYKSNTSINPEEQKITAFPDIRIINIEPEDKFIVLACDGIWDCLSNQDVVDFVNSQLSCYSQNSINSMKLSSICEVLCNRCLSQNPLESEGGVGCDNMTIMIILLGEHLCIGSSVIKRTETSDAPETDQPIILFYGPTPDIHDLEEVNPYELDICKDPLTEQNTIKTSSIIPPSNDSTDDNVASSNSLQTNSYDIKEVITEN